MNEVKVNNVYRHFKGNYYYVKDIAYDSETLERVVIYTALYDEHKTYVRKESVFLEEIGERSDNVTGQKVRFELIDMGVK